MVVGKTNCLVERIDHPENDYDFLCSYHGPMIVDKLERLSKNACLLFLLRYMRWTGRCALFVYLSNT